MELQNLTLLSKQEKEGVPVLKGEIASFKLEGVKLLKAIFRIDRLILDKLFLDIKSDSTAQAYIIRDVFLKGWIFDRENTFEAHGTLSAMEAMEMNPVLEKNAFL